MLAVIGSPHPGYIFYQEIIFFHRSSLTTGKGGQYFLQLIPFKKAKISPNFRPKFLILPIISLSFLSLMNRLEYRALCSALVIMQLYSPDLTVMIVLPCKYILNVIGSRFFLSIAANLQ